MRIRYVLSSVFVLLLVTYGVGYPKSGASGQDVAAASTAAPPIPAHAAKTHAAKEAAAQGQSLFEQECSQCHDLSRVNARTEAKERWAEIVKKMQAKPGSGISDADAARILDYLVAGHAAASEGQSLFEQKCSQCHGLTRVTSRAATKKQWEAIVAKMKAKTGSGISDADAARILDYLVAQHKTAPQM
jgi:mono/diheme cytochrome c family protein